LCLVVEDGLDAALMPVKMTTHRLHTSYVTTFLQCVYLGLRNGVSNHPDP
jgi:hypothetical protein